MVHRSSFATPRPACSAEVAEQEIITVLDKDRLLAILREEGFTADVNENGILIWKLGGYRTQLFISEKTGSNIQFHSSFGDGSATLKKVNDWNATKRYSKTYLDDEGDPHLELDLDLEGGVTRARLVDFLRTCRQSFDVWLREVVE